MQPLQLISQCPEYAVDDIPSKTIFRASPDLVSRRRGQLEKFLQGVVQSEPLATSECTLQVNAFSYIVLPVSTSLVFLQFFRPNRERRLLSVYPGTAGCGPEGDAGSPVLRAPSTASARQGAAAAEAAGDRFAVDWSGSFASIVAIPPDRVLHATDVLERAFTPRNMSNKHSYRFRCGLDLRSI